MYYIAKDDVGDSFTVGISPGGKFYHAINDGTSWAEYITTLAPATNVWYHVAWVRDGNSNLIFYLNGEARANFSSVKTPFNIGYAVRIGSAAGFGFMNGNIDESRVYNRALSADEIRRLYRQTSPQMNASQANKLRQGLVGMWTFDGNDMSGNTAIDRSGNGNNGTLTNGPKKVIGKIGQALNFDGVDDYIFVNDPGDSSVLDFDTSSTITMSAWIRKSSLTSYPLIVTKGRSNGSYTNYAIRSGDGTGSERKFSFFYRNSANTAWHVYDTVSNVFEVGNWYHVAVSYTFGTGSSIKMYINGVEMPGGWVAGTGNDAPLVGNFQLWIGDDNANSEFHGLIDEVRVYNRALTPAEIRQLYKAGSSFHPNTTNKSTIRDGLVGHWTFDGADMGTTSARDASGNANTGWLINGTKKAIGKIGQALNFDGVDDYVDASTANVPLPATMSLFFYIDKNPTSDQALFSHNSGSNNGYRMGLNSTDATTFTLGGVVDYPFTNLVTSGAGWYFFAITVTGNSGTATGYFTKVGGALVTQSNAIGNPSGTPNRFTIGRRGDNVTFFPGLIDEVRVYNRALSPDEVKRLYNMGR